MKISILGGYVGGTLFWKPPWACVESLFSALLPWAQMCPSMGTTE